MCVCVCVCVWEEEGLDSSLLSDKFNSSKEGWELKYPMCTSISNFANEVRLKSATSSLQARCSKE